MFSTVNESTTFAALIFQAIMYECNFCALWPYNYQGIQSNSEVNIGSCQEYASGIVVNAFGHKYYFNAEEAKKGWRWEESGYKFRRAYVMKFGGHWEVLLSAAHLLFLIHHPMLPRGWEPSLMHPLSQSAAQSCWMLPFGVWDKTGYALERAQEKWIKSAANFNKSPSVPVALQTQPEFAKHHIRVGDLIEFTRNRETHAAEFGVVVAIVMTRSKDSGNPSAGLGQILNDLITSGASATRTLIAAGKFEGDESTIEQAIKDAVLGFMRFIPSIHIITCPISLLSKDLGPQGPRQDELFIPVRPHEVVDVIDPSSAQFAVLCTDYKVKVDKPIVDNIDMIMTFSDELMDRLCYHLKDNYLDQERFLTSIFNTGLPRLNEIKAHCVNVSTDDDQLPFDGPRNSADRREADLYSQVLATASKDGFEISRFKSAMILLRYGRPLYRTPNFERTMIYREAHANSTNAEAGPKLTIDEKAKLLTMYGHSAFLAVEAEAKERDAIVQSAWSTIFMNGADKRIPMSEAALKKVIADNIIMDWSIMSAVDKGGYRKIDIEQSTAVQDMSANDPLFNYHNVTAQDIEFSKESQRLEVIERQRLADLKKKKNDTKDKSNANEKKNETKESDESALKRRAANKESRIKGTPRVPPASAGTVPKTTNEDQLQTKILTTQNGEKVAVTKTKDGKTVVSPVVRELRGGRRAREAKEQTLTANITDASMGDESMDESTPLDTVDAKMESDINADESDDSPSPTTTASQFNSVSYNKHQEELHQAALMEQDEKYPALARMPTYAQLYPGKIVKKLKAALLVNRGNPFKLWLQMSSDDELPFNNWRLVLGEYFDEHPEHAFPTQRQSACSYELAIISKLDPQFYLVRKSDTIDRH